VRYGVLAFVCILSMITYLDRVCMASAADGFRKDLGLHGAGDFHLVFAAFALAYALFEVPSGWLGDVFGPRNVLIRIVLWWSAFTAVTGVIGIRLGEYMLGGVGLLIVVRFLFGMGEAGAYPNITRALHNWFPLSERGFAQGAVWMCGRLMGGLTPLIWMVLVEGVRNPWAEAGDLAAGPWLPPLLPHWRASFWFFGVAGVIWCVFFALWFRNRPEQKSSVNAAELAWIRSSAAESQAAHAGVPWLRILKSRNLWILCLMYACQAYGWYFYITYLPSFLKEQYEVPDGDFLGALYKGGPLWLGAVGCLTGGFLTDWFIRRTGNRRLGRKLFGVIGHTLSALCFVAVYLLVSQNQARFLQPQTHRPNPFWFFLAISLAGFFTDITMASAWAVCQDIGKRYAAIVAGFMNMIGNVGGTLATWISGFVLQRSLAAHAERLGKPVADLSALEKAAGNLPGYETNFLLFAAVCVVGVCCWLQIDATKPVAPEEEGM
jgi:MFS family permease